MGSPVNDSYTAATGATIYAGRAASGGGATPPAPAAGNGQPYVRNIQPAMVPGPVPAWVPPSGYYADVPMHSTPQSLDSQCLLGSGATSDCFDIWGGSAVLRDWSPLGAQVYYSGGHESSAGQPNNQVSVICDFSTLLWSVANQPVAPNSSSSFSSVTGEAPDGTQYCPHTYLGLQEFPAAWGGGAKGQLLSIDWSGAPFENRVNIIDPSKAQNGYSFFTVNNPGNSVNPAHMHMYSADNQHNGSYIVSYQDDVRQGWWIDTNGTHDWMYFQKPDGSLTKYPCLNGNSQDGCLVACGSLNLLMFFDGGYQSSGTSYRSVNVRNLTTGAITSFQTAGPVPFLSTGYDGVPNNYHAPGKMGLQWVEELGAIFGHDPTSTPPSIVKLTPPATGDKASTPWTWSVVPMQHWDAGDPGGQALIQNSVNPTWSKFRWVPALHAFVMGTAANRKPQVFKI